MADTSGIFLELSLNAASFLNMRALLLEEYKKLRLVDFPKPSPGKEEVLVRIKACGVCGSDIHGYDGSSGRRIPPIIMGHEASGVVESVGEGVDRFSEGDRVVFDSTIWCGKCEYCLSKLRNLCVNRRVIGVSCKEYRQHGAFAEYLVVPERIVYRLPSAVSFEQAALIEAVSVAWHAVSRLNSVLGKHVAVFGVGIIGLLVVQVLRLCGCSRILAIDIDDARLLLAKKFGATDCLNTKTDIKRFFGSLSNKVDISFDVVGKGDVTNLAISAVKKGGSVVLIGNLQAESVFPLQHVVTNEITIYGSCASSGEYPEIIDAFATGKIDVDPLISACAPLEEGPVWFERLYNREPGLLKVILRP